MDKEMIYRKYFGRFKSLEDVKREFEVPDGKLFPTEKQLLFASYDVPSYEGSALVVFKIGKKYYWAHGSHCSCYGLENQWDPEEVDKAVLCSYNQEYNDDVFSDGAGEKFRELFPYKRLQPKG